MLMGFEDKNLNLGIFPPKFDVQILTTETEWFFEVKYLEYICCKFPKIS